MRAMILAAGRGVRMGALTAGRPKPLLDIGGESLLGRQLRRLAAAGIEDVVINLSYQGEQIRSAIGDGAGFGLRVIYSDEGPEPLETAGGIVRALPILGDAPFLVVNADVVSDFDFSSLEPGPGLGTLVMVPNPRHCPAGDYGIDAGSRLTLTPPKFTFAGISVLAPALFAGLGEGKRALAGIFEAAIGKRQLYGRLHSGFWMDVGTAERLEAARAALTTG